MRASNPRGREPNRHSKSANGALGESAGLAPRSRKDWPNDTVVKVGNPESSLQLNRGSLNLDEDLDVDQTAASLGLTSSRRHRRLIWPVRVVDPGAAMGDRFDRAGRVHRWNVGR
jgi:hypothetical protein